MAKKRGLSSARAARLLAVVRDGADPVAEDQAAVDWLHGDVLVDALDVAAGLAAVAVARELGDADRVSDAATARDRKVRKAARVAAHALRTAGVVLPSRSASRTWTLGQEERTIPAPQALLGLPETDGYVPYLLATYGPSDVVISGGAAGPVRGFRDADSLVSSRSQARRILDDARGDYRLFEFGFFEAVTLLEHVFDVAGGQRPGDWMQMLSALDPGILNAARKLDPFRALATELDDDALHRPNPLLDGRWACPIQVSESHLDGFLRKAISIFTGAEDPDREAQRRAIEQVVDDATTAWLDGPRRQTWVFGLNVVALLASRTPDTEATAVARATALALEVGRRGQDIPWAREWTNRHLSYATEYAREMSR